MKGAPDHLQHEAMDDRYSFARFARHPFFQQVNRWLVEHVGPLSGRRIVDLACGPGAVTELLLERAGGHERTRIFAIDPSASELRKARERIASRIVEFMRGRAESLSRLVSQVDVVVFCNAVHLIEKKEEVFAEIRRSLAPGGVLGFNTTFFSGCYPEGTARFWRRWVLRAMQLLKREGYEVATASKVPARDWLSADEYVDLAKEVGFQEAHYELQQVTLPPESLEDIARFSLFIEGALPGVPLARGSEALIEGLHQTLRELDLQFIPRNWMQCTAVAPA